MVAGSAIDLGESSIPCTEGDLSRAEVPFNEGCAVKKDNLLDGSLNKSRRPNIVDLLCNI